MCVRACVSIYIKERQSTSGFNLLLNLSDIRKITFIPLVL